MKEFFVPYEIAKQLKEKGFDKLCVGAYDLNGEFYLNYFQSTINVQTPLYQQAIDWLRETHKIHITITNFVNRKGLKYAFKIDCFNEKNAGEYESSCEYSTYYKALIFAIKESIKLI